MLIAINGNTDTIFHNAQIVVNTQDATNITQEAADAADAHFIITGPGPVIVIAPADHPSSVLDFVGVPQALVVPNRVSPPLVVNILGVLTSNAAQAANVGAKQNSQQDPQQDAVKRQLLALPITPSPRLQTILYSRHEKSLRRQHEILR